MKSNEPNLGGGIEVDQVHEGKRLDVFLHDYGFGLSKRKIKAIFDSGAVKVNGAIERFASRKAKSGDIVEILVSRQELEKEQPKISGPLDIDARVIYEDDTILIFNKPPGLLSQATRDSNLDHVISVLQESLPAKYWLCHRLDKETSGALILAKTKRASEKIYAQFKYKNVKKTYYAIVSPIPDRKNWTENSFLSSVGKKSGRVDLVRSGGSPSQTHFEVIKSSRADNISLVKCIPTTGRTHQIRVHLESNGTPIVGDKLYGNGSWRELKPGLVKLASKHHMLHAAEVEFTPPDLGEPIKFYAIFPDDFINFLKRTGTAPPKLLKFE